MVDAVREAHQALKRLQYPIRPDGEEAAFAGDGRRGWYKVFLLVKTPAGKYVASNHCSTAVGETTALDERFNRLVLGAGLPMTAWNQLRTAALVALEKRA